MDDEVGIAAAIFGPVVEVDGDKNLPPRLAESAAPGGRSCHRSPPFHRSKRTEICEA